MIKQKKLNTKPATGNRSISIAILAVDMFTSIMEGKLTFKTIEDNNLLSSSFKMQALFNTYPNNIINAGIKIISNGLTIIKPSFPQ